MQLQEALERYLVQLQADGRSKHTQSQARRHVRAFASWLGREGHATDVRQITPDLLAQFFSSEAARLKIDRSPRRPGSVNAHRSSLRSFCRWAHDSGLAPQNAARLLRLARCKSAPPRGLKPSEVDNLLALLSSATGAAVDRDRTLIELLLGTGIRIGSAVALDVEDLDLSHGEARLRSVKNNWLATVVLPRTVADSLEGHLEGHASGPVFRGSGGRISVRQAQRRISDWFRAAGIEGRSAHALRHTFATSLLSRTSDLRLVQAALHHASITSTTIYAHVDESRLRAALEA